MSSWEFQAGGCHIYLSFRKLELFFVDFKVLAVTEETGVVGRFTVLLEHSFVWVKSTCWVSWFSSGAFGKCRKVSA